jgi:sugar phosphate isomerase/epimerase
VTRFGTDVKLFDGTSPVWGDPMAMLDGVKAFGLDGLNLRTLDELSPTLDAGFLAEWAAHARELGLYIEMGLGKVNPYMTAELPRVRDIGEGSYLIGMQRMIAACAEHGWTNTWTALGGYKGQYTGLYITDRFRADAPWPDQLAATARFLHRLAPALREHGVSLNLETHEEATTFELVRLVQEVGDDVIGICLDPGNMPVRGEVPNDGIARVAPYVRSTQLRDAALLRTGDTIARFLAPCGDGVVDWDDALRRVLAANPDVNLTVEPIGPVRAEMPILDRDPEWLASHVDLGNDELDRLRGAADAYALRATAGEVEDLEQLRALRPATSAHHEFLARSVAHLRATVDRLALVGAGA